MDESLIHQASQEAGSRPYPAGDGRTGAILHLKLTISKLQLERTPSFQRSYSMSVEVGLPTTLVEQSCSLSLCRELNSLCRFNVFSRNLM